MYFVLVNRVQCTALLFLGGIVEYTNVLCQGGRIQYMLLHFFYTPFLCFILKLSTENIKKNHRKKTVLKMWSQIFQKKSKFWFKCKLKFFFLKVSKITFQKKSQCKFKGKSETTFSKQLCPKMFSVLSFRMENTKVIENRTPVYFCLHHEFYNFLSILGHFCCFKA